MRRCLQSRNNRFFLAIGKCKYRAAELIYKTHSGFFSGEGDIARFPSRLSFADRQKFLSLCLLQASCSAPSEAGRIMLRTLHRDEANLAPAPPD